jgi:NADPH2:quinone reductase
MKAIEITEFGGPDVLKLAERPTPQPGGRGADRVAASGVNRPDVFQRKGNYAPPPGASDLPGLEIAGEIVGGDLDSRSTIRSVEEGRSRLRVAGGRRLRGICGRAAAAMSAGARGAEDIEAASLPETTSRSGAMCSIARLGAGEGGESEVLLVQGGTSGIGVTAVQIAACVRLSRVRHRRSATTSAARSSSSVPSAASTTGPRISSKSSRN